MNSMGNEADLRHVKNAKAVHATHGRFTRTAQVSNKIRECMAAARVCGTTFRAGGFAEGAQPLDGEGVGRERADVVQDCQLHAAPASCQRLFKRGRHISGTPRQPV